MRGMYHGTLTIAGAFRGMLTGTAIVAAGTCADIGGMVSGTLIVERDAVVTISGMVNGSIVDRGGTITVTGMAAPIVAAG
ncbi:MAG: hypothetical protein V4537_07210 [Pseudomonadota bacterium]